MQKIQIQSENPIELIWSYLAEWESTTLVKIYIKENAESMGINLQDKVLDDKATGTVYFIKNAILYFNNETLDWTKRILLSYYGLMSFIGAIIISDPASQYNIEKVEEATKKGHGLGNISVEDGDYFDAEKIYLSQDGIFTRYLANFKHDISKLKFNCRPDISKLNEEEKSKLISMKDLFSRIPEIGQMYYRVTGNEPFFLNVFYAASENHPSNKPNFNPASRQINNNDVEKNHYIGVKSIDENIGVDFLNKIGIPLNNFNYHDDTFFRYWFGETNIKGKRWWDCLKTYSSVYSGTTWVKPLLGILDDRLILDYMIHYQLSIVVRYRPKLWREISSGKFDNYFAIIRSYFNISQRIIPQLILEKLTLKKIIIAQSGSMNATL